MNSKKSLIAIVAAAITVVVLSANEAYADNIRRSCDARMYLDIQSYWVPPKPQPGVKQYQVRPIQKTLERFSASAGCGKSVPNRCRQRARDRATKCASLAWDTRWERDEPEACQPSNGIGGYDMPNIKCDIYKRICKAKQQDDHRPPFYKETGELWVEVTGKTKKCDSRRKIGEYVVEKCTFEEERKHCGS